MCAVRSGEVCLRRTALNARGAVVSAVWNEPEILSNHASRARPTQRDPPGS
jgi:hypothetical protein